MTHSDRRVIVQAKFDKKRLGDVGKWIAARRKEGLSWVDVSFEMRQLIGMPISYETLRRWGQELEKGNGNV